MPKISLVGWAKRRRDVRFGTVFIGVLSTIHYHPCHVHGGQNVALGFVPLYKHIAATFRPPYRAYLKMS